jgi:hypothetical protein
MLVIEVDGDYGSDLAGIRATIACANANAVP